MKKPLVLLMLTLAALLLLPGPARAAPQSHIDEYVTADFFMNGTMKNDSQRIGYVSVSVGNNLDVLQYIEMNTSWSSNTNLNIIPGTAGSERSRAHRSTAASPIIGTERTRMYLNTTDDEEALYYTLDSLIAPQINVSMDYANEDGGTDIHGSLNTLNFTINLTSNQNLAGALLQFTVDEDLAGRDAMNIINPSASSGSAARQDTDFDGTYDRLVWSGDIPYGGMVTIYFEGEVEKDVNFDSSLFTYLDLEGECMGQYSQSSTFSGITFGNRFSRGPVRQGIDLIEEGTWSVQGFIMNMAKGLEYVVDGWEIYEVGSYTPIASSSLNLLLEPSDVYYTTKQDTGNSTKKYYSSSFDWKVIWGSSRYSGQTTSYIDMPFLYLIDSSIGKNVIIDENTESGRALTIQDTVGHIGDPTLNVDVIRLNSSIPHLSQEGYTTLWNVRNIRVLYRSGANETDITGLATIFSGGSTSSQDGYVNVTVTSADLGEFMTVGDEIVLSYELTSPSSSATNTYYFGLETILVTESGTPDYKSLYELTAIPGVGQPPGPGGGGAAGPAVDTAWIQAEDSRAYVIIGNLAEVKVIYGIRDTGDKGIRDMGLVVFIPEDGKLLEERTDLDIMMNEEWKKLVLGTDYLVKNEGVVLVGDSRYRQYVIDFIMGTGMLNLYDGDKIKIAYNTELPYGLNELITEANGYNYYEDKIVSEEVHSLIRIGVKVSKFQYVRDEWVQGLAMVGRPVTWLREFRVKNPNDVAAEDSFVSDVFEDTLSAYVVTEDGEKKELNIMPDNKVSWGIRMGANEEKSIYLQVLTPPVMEITRIITPLLSNETWVNFDMNSTVKNFALEDYMNVTYVLPYPVENVISYEGLEGLRGNNDQTDALIGDMISGENVSFYIRYIQKPPILIVTTNGFNFTNMDMLDVRIMVIPTENEEKGYIEVEAVGPVDRQKTLYGDMMAVEGKKGSINEFNMSIVLDNFVPGTYVLKTNFKKDFVTVLRDEKEFMVGGGRLLFDIGYNLLLLVLAVFIWFMFSRVERKKDKFREELRRLRSGRLGKIRPKEGIRDLFRRARERMKNLFRKRREESIYGKEENI